MFKIGDKLYCKKNFGYNIQQKSTPLFIKNKYYKINYDDINTGVDIGYIWDYFYINKKTSGGFYIWDFFYTPNEVRKLKLKQLNNV